MVRLLGSVILVLVILPGARASAQAVRLRASPPNAGNSAFLLLEAHPGDGYLIFCSAQRGGALVQVGGQEVHLGLARPKLLTGRLESRSSRVGSEGRVTVPIRLPDGADQVEFHFQAVVGEPRAAVVTNVVSLTRRAESPSLRPVTQVRPIPRALGSAPPSATRAASAQDEASPGGNPWTVREDEATGPIADQENPESPPRDAFGYRTPLPPRNGSELPGGGFRAPEPVRARD